MPLDKHTKIVILASIVIIPLFFIFGGSITLIYLAITGVLLYIFFPSEKKALIIFIFLVGVIIPILSDAKDFFSPKPYIVIYVNRNSIVDTEDLKSTAANEIHTHYFPITNTQYLFFNNYVIESKEKKSFNYFLIPAGPAAAYSILIKNEGKADLKEDILISGKIDSQDVDIKKSDSRIFLNDATDDLFGQQTNILFEIKELKKGKTTGFIMYSNDKVADIKFNCENYKNCEFAMNDVFIYKIDKFPFTMKSGGEMINVPDLKNLETTSCLIYKDSEWKNISEVHPHLSCGEMPT